VSIAASSRDFLKTVKVGALPITMISVTAKLIATEVAILATVSPTKLTMPAAISSLEAVLSISPSFQNLQQLCQEAEDL